MLCITLKNFTFAKWEFVIERVENMKQNDSVCGVKGKADWNWEAASQLIQPSLLHAWVGKQENSCVISVSS